LFFIFDIEAKYQILKVVYLISKKPLILKASILKKPFTSGVAKIQMHCAYDDCSNNWELMVFEDDFQVGACICWQIML
jgi:hypothetical protein